MEDKAAQAARFALIRSGMPRVTSIVTEKRRLHGDAFVTECIRRGMAGEPGWFFAREGGLAVGTPWDGLADMWADTSRAQQVLVSLRTPEAGDGSH